MNKKILWHLIAILLTFLSTYGYAADKENVQVIHNGGYSFLLKRYAPEPIRTSENAFLTPEQLRKIKPMPLPQKQGLPSTNNYIGQTKHANSILVPGTIPSESENVSGRQADSYSYPFPYTKAEVMDGYGTYPYSAMGLVVSYFGSLYYSCSGSAVNSDGGSFVMTAAHCVYNKGKLADKVYFLPAYKDGGSPKGEWLADAVLVSDGYKQYPYPGSYDIAGIGVFRNGSGKALHTVVGALGFAANIDPLQHWNAFGYPSEPEPYNGERLRTCQASLGAEDFTDSPAALGIGCDMGGGSSGGPWIINFQRSTKPSKKAPLVNMINGMNDYGYPAFPDAEFSPYFGDMAASLRDALIQLGY